MCGRYTLEGRVEQISARLGIRPFALTPRYNIAPGQLAAVITQSPESEIQMLRWGLIPAWAKEANVGFRMINARAESLREKPSFKPLLSRHRCAVLADGWYEWKRSARSKRPHHFRLRSRGTFAFAGLWTTWSAPDGSPMRTFTVITTAANPVAAPIHDRMPALLRPNELFEWLDPKSQSPEDGLTILRPYAGSDLEVMEVSSRVNNARHEGPECLDPAAEASDPPELF